MNYFAGPNSDPVIRKIDKAMKEAEIARDQATEEIVSIQEKEIKTTNKERKNAKKKAKRQTQA